MCFTLYILIFQVLQRKTEEASMATKRLKELLESRKALRETFGWITIPLCLFGCLYKFLYLISFASMQVVEIKMVLEFKYVFYWRTLLGL